MHKRDRDALSGALLHHRVQGFGIEEVLTAPRSPWQNPHAERLVGSVRRECLESVTYVRHVTNTRRTTPHTRALDHRFLLDQFVSREPLQKSIGRNYPRGGVHR